MPPRPRQCVLDLAPYQSPDEGRYGQTRLDFNENTSGSPEAMWGKEPHWLGTYPEYGCFTAQLAEHLAVSKESLLLTNGSDEALALLIQAYIEANRDTAIISEPTFMMIPHYLKLAEAKIISVPVTNALAFF